jgi:hypothetical protein
MWFNSGSSMLQTPNAQDALSEKLLVLARYWRKCAANSHEPLRSEMMTATAQEFEKAADSAISKQTLSHHHV